MKIAFISAAKSIHIVRWANAMAERGHDVSVISCANDISNLEAYISEVKIVKLKYSAPLGYYFNARRLKRIIKTEKYDVINIHYASGYGTLGRRAKLKNALLNIWGSDVYDFPYQSFFKMRLIKRNLRYFKYTASTSNCMAKQAKKLVDREYYITPFGVDTKLFKPIPDLKSKDKIIFGTVKTLSPKYGITNTISAFIQLYKRLISENCEDLASKLYYEIYGRGEQQDQLQKLIDDNGMTHRIKLCGFVENCKLPEIYNQFDIACYGSVLNSESFGVAAVEAMACGVPVCVTDADGFVEVVEDGVTGLISPKKDVDAMAENMYTLLMDEALRGRMRKAGVESVKNLYDWRLNTDTMENIYNSIVSD